MFLTPASASRSMHDVVYPGQPLEPQQIRIVRLHPGAWNDPITCTLENVDITTAKYEALSYVWGSKHVTRCIRLNNRIYPVTVNLEGALKHLRAKFQNEIVLWVDALCIDQKNGDERTRQVQLMGTIYTNCTRVIVYLGDQLSPSSASEGQPAILDFDVANSNPDAETHYEGVRRSGLRDVFKFMWELSNLAHEHLQSMGAFQVQESAAISFFEALRQFFQTPFTPWWSRIWVVQEITVASSPLVMYGTYSASWNIFATAATKYGQHSTTCCKDFVAKQPRDQVRVLSDCFQKIHDVNNLRRWLNASPLSKKSRIVEHGTTSPDSLLELLRAFRDRKASDSRDKIYALLTLARIPSELPPIVPNYSLDEVAVFREATLHIIAETKSLSLLSTELGRKFRDDLPSWVPDWGAPGGLVYGIRAEVVELYQASAALLGVHRDCHGHLDDTTAGHVKFVPNDTCLTLKGFYIDTIDRLGEVMWGDDAMSSQKTLRNWWTDFRSLLLEEDMEITIGAQIFIRTVCADIMCGSKLGNRSRRISPEDELIMNEWFRRSERAHGLQSDTASAFSPREQWRRIFQLWRDYPSHQFLPNPGRRLFEIRAHMRIYEMGLRSMEDFLATDKDIEAEYEGLHGESFGISPITYSDRTLGMARARLDAMDRLDRLDRLMRTRKKADPEKLMDMVDESIMSATLGQRFIISKNQKTFGLVPSGAKEGDQLFILSGGKTPFVLRSVAGDKTRSTFEVVGACYLHGLMDGGINERQYTPWRDVHLV